MPVALLTRVKATPVTSYFTVDHMTLPAFDAVVGSLIVVPSMFSYSNGETITGVTDTAGNTYVRGNWQQETHDTSQLELWYCLSSAAKTGNIVTVQCSRTFREAAAEACQYSTPSGATWAYSGANSTPASGTSASASYVDTSVPLVSPTFSTAGPGVVYLQGSADDTNETLDSGNTTGYDFSPDTTNGASGIAIQGTGVRINTAAQTGVTAQLAIGASGTHGRTILGTHSFTYTGGGSTNDAVGNSALGALASSGTVGQTNPASGTSSLGALVCVGAVTLLSAAVGVSSLGALGSSGTLAQVNHAAGSSSLPALTTAGTLGQRNAATGNSSLGALASTGTITTGGGAIGNSSIGPLSSTGSIGQTNPATGTASLGALQTAGVITQTNRATGSASLGALHVQGTFTQTNRVQGNSALGAFVASGTFVQLNPAVGNSSIGPLVSVGTITPAGTQQAIGDSSLGALVSTGVIGQVNMLAGNVSLGGLSASGVVGQLNAAAGSSQLGPLACAGTLSGLNAVTGNSALGALACSGIITVQVTGGYALDPRYFVQLVPRPFYAALDARSFYAALNPRTFYILSDPQMTPTFDNKDPRETVVLTFDASADLDPGETLTGTPQIAISVLRGSDPGYATVVANPVINNSALSVGGASIATSHAVQAIATGGLGGCWYLVAITCTTSNMEKVLTMKGVLPVTAT